jgi:hypothetical protein
MKCGRCGLEIPDKTKFCPECGFDLKIDQSVALLYGQEVEVLFFFETGSDGKISGVVNPTLDQFQNHQLHGVLQRVLIGSHPMGSLGSNENASSILSFIKKSLEFLAEPYDEERYRHLSLPDLKKEYLRLFERVLKFKAQRLESLKPGEKTTNPPTKK